MADMGEIPLDCASDKDGFRAAKECFEVGDDELCKKDEVEKLGSLSGLGQEKEEIRIVERGVKVGCEDDCGKINVERVLSDNGLAKKLCNKGCLIEEDTGKVSLDGGSSVFVLVGASENDKKVGGDLSGAYHGEVNDIDRSKTDEMIKLNGSGSLDGHGTGIVDLNKNGENNPENASDEDENVGDISAADDVQINGVNGLKSGGLDDLGIADATGFDGNGIKCLGNVGDENESDSDSESESESSSSISISSSSSSDEGDEPEDGCQDSGPISDEKKSKIEKGVIEEEMAREEYEVMLSDADEMVASGDDEDGDGSSMAGSIMSKNELKVLPPIPSVTVTLQPHHQTFPVGIILSIIGTQVIVEGIEKHTPLNEGSILWITDGRLPLGIVDEIFGPVKNPYYVVRYNSESEVPAGILQGTSVSFVKEFANYVLNDKNLYQKGYDASGENDEELSDELEFSDDEKEAEYKRMLKMKKRGTNESKPGTKRKEKRQFKKIRNWNCNQVLVPNSPSGGDRLQEGQHLVPSVTTSLNIENHTCSSILGQGLAGNNAMSSIFPVRGQPHDFCTPNRIWSNEFPQQQHQNIGLPNELAANVTSWALQNHPHQLYQMPLPSNMAFQQQVSTIPGLPGNFSLGGHSNLGRAPAFGPWPAVPHQNVFNQSQLGMVLQTPNAGEQAVQSDGSFHLLPMPVSHGGPQNINQGGGGGREVHHRGGRHSGGGRGRYRHH